MFSYSIEIWIENFLNKTSPTLNNLPPCPFAKQALINNKIKIHQRPNGLCDRVVKGCVRPLGGSHSPEV